MNHRENGWFIKNCARRIATYANCGHGSHGKIEPAMAIMQRITHIIHQTISIYIFCMVNIIRLNNYQNITV